jgi:PTH1 family peptidyl-tRNA hydrolase
VLLFVGLGNPGATYAMTRHNIGFRVIDALVAHFEAREITRSTFHGALFKSPHALFLKPTTYMNHSGKSVQTVKQFYKIAHDRLVVIHDDLDLPFGALRLKQGGGHGGHNGLKSIDGMIGEAYLRVRMGISKPEYKSQVADYVLSPFSDLEQPYLADWIAHARKACEQIDQMPLERIKSRYSMKSIAGLVT